MGPLPAGILRCPLTSALEALLLALFLDSLFFGGHFGFGVSLAPGFLFERRVFICTARKVEKGYVTR